MATQQKSFKVLASCKAKVRDPERIYTGWPRNPFSETPNAPWRYVVAVKGKEGTRWVIIGNRRPALGSKIYLTASASGAPLCGYRTLQDLKNVAVVTVIKTSPDFVLE